jgi:acetoacetyl-CoA synthetase
LQRPVSISIENSNKISALVNSLTALSAVVGGNVMVPLNGPELAAPALGLKVEIWNQDGINIEHTGDKGELVITKPFFSMPIFFWGDDGQEKYRKAYFDAFPGAWCHGDFISKNTKTGGYIIHGRSDGVLNPGGISILKLRHFLRTN